MLKIEMLKVVILLLVFVYILLKIVKRRNEKYDKQPGPWGEIGTGQICYKYHYILHNIKY